MSGGTSQNLMIEVNAEGKKVIPYIKPEAIITVHGKNGVGKSNGAKLLEIATGNYVFENEDKFIKLKNVFNSCDISFKDDTKILYHISLKPHLWKFDNNLNRINPLTLGNFFKGEQNSENAINFKDLQKELYIRTIRGNESLAQQIYFFKDIFIAKITQKLQKLDDKISYLESYEKWLEEEAEEKIVDEYTKLQDEYNDQLNQMSNFTSAINTRKSNITTLHKKCELLEKLVYITENDINSLQFEKEKKEERINTNRNEITSKQKKLAEIEKQLETYLENFDKKTKAYIKKSKKLQKKSEKLKEQLESKIELDISPEKIEENIKQKKDQLETLKKEIENLNKENDRIIEINKYLTQLRDICSRASSTEFGNERLIKAQISNTDEIELSFSELYQIFQDNNRVFKQDIKLKEYKEKVLEFNESIKESRAILELLKEYNKILKKIKKIEQNLKGKDAQLDTYIGIETRVNALEQKKETIEKQIGNLEQEILKEKSQIDEISKIITKINDISSKSFLKTELNKLHVNIEYDDNLIESCTNLIETLKEEIKEDTARLSEMEIEKKKIEKQIEHSKEKLDPLIQKLKKAARNFGYTEEGKFIAYFTTHREKFHKYLEQSKTLQTRLSVLKNDIEKILEGQQPKNKAHLDIVSEQFDGIFKNIYAKPEFFKYVFKEYERIKKFDIGNKTIIFETPAGLEEVRDLDEFSSGEKTYAYCRSIISMSSQMAKHNIVILDESYALLDHEHSQNLYNFQEEMIKQGGITKFINILPLKENLDEIIQIMQSTLSKEEKRENVDKLSELNGKLSILKDFNQEVSEKGYYQEIHYPESKRKELHANIGYSLSSGQAPKTTPTPELMEFPEDPEEEKLAYSFILDGSNIARDNPNSRKASIRDVIKCKNKLQDLGIPEKNIIILFGSGLRHHIPPRDKQLYSKLLTEKNINQAPAGRDDDWFIIQFALKNNSLIITNDRFLDYREKYPKYESFIDSHSVRYSVIGNDIYFDEGFEEKVKTIIAKN